MANEWGDEEAGQGNEWGDIPAPLENLLQQSLPPEKVGKGEAALRALSSVGTAGLGTLGFGLRPASRMGTMREYGGLGQAGEDTGQRAVLRAAEVERDKQALRDQPLASIAAGGPAALLAAPFLGAARAPSLVGRLVQASKIGAGMGGLSGYTQTTKPEELAGNMGGNALVGAVAGPALQGAGEAAGAGLRAASGGLRNWAQRAAVRSTNATQQSLDTATRGDPAKRLALGEFMLQEGLSLRSPQAIKTSAGKVAAEAGAEMGRIAKAADQTGATVSLRATADEILAQPRVAALGKNTESRAGFDRIQAFLEDQLTQHGDEVPPSVAHDIRRQLDNAAGWDERAPKDLKRAWRAARRTLDDSLDDTMSTAGMADEWTQANSRVANARTLTKESGKGLADVGAKRRVGNRTGSPSEKAAALVGAGTLAFGNPAAGIAIPAAAVALNRFGYPVGARAAQGLGSASGALGRLMSPVPQASGVSGQAMTPKVRAWLAALEEQLGVRLAPAGAEESR